MHIERKLTTFALVVVGLTASLAFAQVGPARGGGGGQGSAGQAAAPVSGLKLSSMQQCLSDMIVWKQSNALHAMGGERPSDYNSLSSELKHARMEVIRACNLYARATLTPAQQDEYDRTILDPVKHPLPAKWETMRQKGTLVTALLNSDKAQQQKAAEVLETFRARQMAIWGHGNDGGYAKNLDLLVSEFRAILTKTQAAEFDKLWNAYLGEVRTAMRSVSSGR